MVLFGPSLSFLPVSLPTRAGEVVTEHPARLGQVFMGMMDEWGPGPRGGRRDEMWSAEYRAAMRQKRGYQPPPAAMSPHSGYQPPPAAMSGPPSAYQPPAAMSRPPSVISGEAAWVLIFNEGRQNEGVYTLQGLSGSAPASVLAFEHVEDADRFAHALHAEGGFDRPTALRWMAGQLATFCDDTGFALEFVPRGEMPIPPSKNEYDPDTMDRGQAGDSERKYPGDGSGRGDPYIAYRLRLEALFPQRPINCADEEDCILPEKEETTALRHDLEGLYPQKPDNCADEDCTLPEQEETTPAPAARLRDDASAAIDAILAAHKPGDDIDLQSLMKSAWEKAEADKKDKVDEEEGGGD
jgi:hypothetical protein